MCVAVAAPAGLKAVEEGLAREVRYHLSSTMGGLGTAGLQALCDQYQVGRREWVRHCMWRNRWCRQNELN